MNKSLVFHYLSKIVLVGSVIMLLPCLVSVYYGEFDSALTFLIVMGIGAVLSLPLAIVKPKNRQMYAREGLVIVALMWIVYPALGALPFYISGEIPNFIDALFESVSGFTTTGSSILTDVEALPKGLIFWRSFTHWVGGMGVLVLAIAILPSSSDSMYLMRAECAGPQVGKIVPKGKTSATYLYAIYFAVTVIIILLLVLGGMPLFDSICHAMGAVGTGGFGIKNSGISYYDSAYIEGVITGGTMLCGVNFSIFYYLLTKRYKDVVKNTELRVYLSIIAIATLLVTINVFDIYGTVGKSFRYAIFQVVTIMTSAGFSTADYCQWPVFSQTILTILMFVGACAGSTGGGFKVQRFVIMFKSAKKSIKQALNPKSVNIVTDEGKMIDIEVVHGIHSYLIIYLGLFLISLLLVSLNDIDFTSSFGAVATCINNIGPAFGSLGPTENFSFLSPLSKIVLTLDMLLGRLECFPIIILLSPTVWRRKKF